MKNCIQFMIMNECKNDCSKVEQNATYENMNNCGKIIRS